MIVKDVLVEALARADHCQRGFGAPASEVVMAERHFNAQLRKYSDNNLITAYQKVLGFTPDKNELIIGKPTYKKGVRITEGTSLPNIITWLSSGHVIGRDYFYLEKDTGTIVAGYYKPVKTSELKFSGTVELTNNTGSILRVYDEAPVCEAGTGHGETGWKLSIDTETGYIDLAATASEEVDMYANMTARTTIGYPVAVEGDGPSSTKAWADGSIKSVEIGYEWERIEDTSTIIETDVDVKVNDMERVVSVMYKDTYERWRKISFVPLSEFYMEDDNDVYNTTNYGENKIKFTIKDKRVNSEFKIVYNCSMQFDKSQTIELPEAHIELLTLATTCAIIREDGDADQSQLQNYMSELSAIEDQIKASTANTRRIVRDYDWDRLNRIDYLKSGRWIFGR